MARLRSRPSVSEVIVENESRDAGRDLAFSVDLRVDGNVIPSRPFLTDYRHEDGSSFRERFEVLGRRFGAALREPSAAEVCLVRCKIDLRPAGQVPALESSERESPPPRRSPASSVLLVHPGVPRRQGGGRRIPDRLHLLDPVSRLTERVERGETEADALVAVSRDDLSSLVDEGRKAELAELATRSRWFPGYQQIREVGLKGSRKQRPRYTGIYDFSELCGKTVVDFGCNTGQACLEAAMAGAKVYGFDLQPEVLDVARRIGETLGLDVTYNSLDFNSETFEDNVCRVVDEWDCALFLAIYRTKQIRNVQDNLDVIVKRTRDLIFFEGHADPTIDTHAFYSAVFDRYPFTHVGYLGHSDLRPGYRLSLLPEDAARPKTEPSYPRGPMMWLQGLASELRQRFAAGDDLPRP